MSEIELLIFVLELFKLRCRGKVDSFLLKELNSDVLLIARASDNLNNFKSSFYATGLCLQPNRFGLRKKFLNYLKRFDCMYDFISCKTRKFKHYDL